MNKEDGKKDLPYIVNDDHVVTVKDLRIMGLELRMEIESKILNLKMEINNKINSITTRLGALIIACSGILFGLLSYFHK